MGEGIVLVLVLVLVLDLCSSSLGRMESRMSCNGAEGCRGMGRTEEKTESRKQKVEIEETAYCNGRTDRPHKRIVLEKDGQTSEGRKGTQRTKKILPRARRKEGGLDKLRREQEEKLSRRDASDNSPMFQRWGGG